MEFYDIMEKFLIDFYKKGLFKHYLMYSMKFYFSEKSRIY